MKSSGSESNIVDDCSEHRQTHKKYILHVLINDLDRPNPTMPQMVRPSSMSGSSLW